MAQPAFDRRHFLRAAGTTVALPMFESLTATVAAAAATVAPEPKAKRLVCIGANLGLHTPAVYPQETGADYTMSPTLKPLESLRSDFTLFSGLDHRAAGGHGNWATYLCGKNVGDVSLDQIVAEAIGDRARFPSFVLGVGQPPSMCYTHGGVALPEITRPSVFYRKMFASNADRKRTEYLLRSGRSSLDHVLEEARGLQARLASSDHRKLDEYFASVRDVEKRIGKQLERIAEPVPVVDYRLPDADPTAPNLMLACEDVMYDLVALALQTDTCHVLAMSIGGASEIFTIDGQTLRFGYHSLSHHGNDPVKIADLIRIDHAHMKSFARFLGQLKEKTGPDGRPLLDDTIVMWGTGMGDASRHSCLDLPIILAGGGFHHGQHIACGGAAAAAKDLLLGDLYITIQRQLGIECSGFSQARRGMDDLLA